MELLSGLIIGALLMYIFTKNPMKIEIIHTDSTPKSTLSAEEIKILEDELVRTDNNHDKELEKLDEAIVEANNILGGSDRI